jgi:ribonuclease HI
MSRVSLYTDGACSGNPGPGGWGALLIFGDHRRELSGGARDTTNNRMELQAVIEGIRALNRRVPVTIYTDSTYVMKGMTEWISGWKAKGWKTAAKKPVKNEDLWRELDAALHGHEVEWRWVKGHAGDPGNEAADALARGAIPGRPG